MLIRLLLLFASGRSTSSPKRTTRAARFSKSPPSRLFSPSTVKSISGRRGARSRKLWMLTFVDLFFPTSILSFCLLLTFVLLACSVYARPHSWLYVRAYDEEDIRPLYHSESA